MIRGQWLFKKGSKTNEDYKNELDKIVYPKLDELKLLAKRENLLSQNACMDIFLVTLMVILLLFINQKYINKSTSFKMGFKLKFWNRKF